MELENFCCQSTIRWYLLPHLQNPLWRRERESRRDDEQQANRSPRLSTTSANALLSMFGRASAAKNLWLFADWIRRSSKRTSSKWHYGKHPELEDTASGFHAPNTARPSLYINPRRFFSNRPKRLRKAIDRYSLGKSQDANVYTWRSELRSTVQLTSKHNCHNDPQRPPLDTKLSRFFLVEVNWRSPFDRS